jgi:hypothetical protein
MHWLILEEMINSHIIVPVVLFQLCKHLAINYYFFGFCITASYSNSVQNQQPQYYIHNLHSSMWQLAFQATVKL